MAEQNKMLISGICVATAVLLLVNTTPASSAVGECIAAIINRRFEKITQLGGS